jgi:hypothetical protein
VTVYTLFDSHSRCGEGCGPGDRGAMQKKRSVKTKNQKQNASLDFGHKTPTLTTELHEQQELLEAGFEPATWGLHSAKCQIDEKFIVFKIHYKI